MENERKGISVDQLIWFICYYWLIIDTITGYFLNANVQFPLSQGIKSLLLCCLIFKLIKNKILSGVLMAIILFFTLNFVSSIFIKYPFSATITHFSKLLLTILLFIYFKKCIATEHSFFFESRAFKVFKYGLIVLSLNVFSGLLGLGYHTYPAGFGYKGFIYSGNEIGGLIVALIPVLLYWSFFSFSKFKYAIISAFSLILGLLISTKACILVICISIFAIPYLYSKPKVKKKILVFCIFFFLICIYYLVSKIDAQSFDLLKRIVFRYDKGGLILVLLSARDEMVLFYFGLLEKAPLFQKIFGMGIGTGDFITVEMDYFDTLFYYGYFGLLVLLLLTFYLLRLLRKNKHNNMMMKTIVLSDIMMLGMAAFAGHILYSSMAGLYIALLNAFMFSNSKYPLIDFKKSRIQFSHSRLKL